MTRWIAVCAPGRKLITEINCWFIPEDVVEVRESQVVEGTTIILIDEDFEIPLPPFEFSEHHEPDPLLRRYVPVVSDPTGHVRITGI